MSAQDISPFSEDAHPNKISPEGANIANTYLLNSCSILNTAKDLNLPTHEVSAVLQEPLVKTYVNSILKENGYRHMIKIAEKLDDLIDKKWVELEEAEIGSNKDIADLLNLAHRMRMDMAKFLQGETPASPSTLNQTQVNVFGKGQYGKLMQKLLE